MQLNRSWHAFTEVSLLDRQCESILAKHGNQNPDGNLVHLRIDEKGSSRMDPFIEKDCVNQTMTLPPICNLDMAVLQSLPPEIISEINEMYCGRLSDFMRKGKDGKTSMSFTVLPQEIEGICSTSYQI